MSYRTAIYQHLAADDTLRELLAVKPEEVGSGPAIYETWAAADSDMPYINLSYSFGAGEDLIKRTGTMTVDIFSDGYDTTKIEAIQRRLIELLDLARLEDPADGLVRLYLATDNEILEEEDFVSHWNLTFTIIHFRRSFLAYYENRRV